MTDTPDTTPTGDGMAKTDTTRALTRAFFMLVFAIFIAVAKNVLILIAVVQALWLLLTGHPNAWVRDFGKSLSVWLGEVARFQSVASDERPFPWKKWPEADEAP